jgi:hypothetical protein
MKEMFMKEIVITLRGENFKLTIQKIIINNNLWACSLNEIYEFCIKELCENGLIDNPSHTFNYLLIKMIKEIMSENKDVLIVAGNENEFENL